MPENCRRAGEDGECTMCDRGHTFEGDDCEPYECRERNIDNCERCYSQAERKQHDHCAECDSGYDFDGSECVEFETGDDKLEFELELHGVTESEFRLHEDDLRYALSKTLEVPERLIEFELMDGPGRRRMAEAVDTDNVLYVKVILNEMDLSSGKGKELEKRIQDQEERAAILEEAGEHLAKVWEGVEIQARTRGWNWIGP